MLIPRYAGAYKRDVRRAHKRRYDLKSLDAVIALLCRSEPLPVRCRPHPLKGDWTGFLECHIGPDWLLIYKVAGKELLLMRTGTHSDLFGE